MTIKYLGRSEFAARIGLKNGDSLNHYDLPEPDAEIGDRRGWLPATIDSWNRRRPGRGRWGARAEV